MAFFKKKSKETENAIGAENQKIQIQSQEENLVPEGATPPIIFPEEPSTKTRNNRPRRNTLKEIRSDKIPTNGDDLDNSNIQQPSRKPIKRPSKNKEPKDINLKEDKNAVKLIPLGGLGEIGRNMMAIEFGEEIIIIDAGVMFPDSTYPGIDLLLPDFSYLKNKSKNIRALIITHGHEDHIGAVPYLLREIPGIPLYAPRMAMELIKGKLNEHRIQYDRKKFTYTEKGKQYNLCPAFSVEYMEVNHSIRDSFGLAIHTPVGTIVHTGDFKIEMDSLGDSEFDFHKFAEIGSKGVLLLCSDSTNVEKKIEEKTEADVTKTIASMIDHAKGRVLIASFASNVNRVANIVEICEKMGKKVCLLGRNMENNFEIAQRLGYVKANKSTIIPFQSVKNHPDHKVVIISTGTQGETLSALTRISQDLHKTIKVKPTDTIIISASVIPGNEKSVSKVLDQLSTKTRHVFYSRNAAVHVSGHAPQSDLLLMLRLVKPKFFMPVHGEKRFLLQHTYLAHNVGIPVKNTLVAQNGDVIQLTEDAIGCLTQLKFKDNLVESGTIGDYRGIIQDRSALAKSGSLFIVIGLDTSDISIPPIIYSASKGFLLPEEEKECLRTIRKHLEDLLQKEETYGQSLGALTGKCKKSVEFLLNSKYNKSPLVELKMIERSK